jgi:hypothetical protein
LRSQQQKPTEISLCLSFGRFSLSSNRLIGEKQNRRPLETENEGGADDALIPA